MRKITLICDLCNAQIQVNEFGHTIRLNYSSFDGNEMFAKHAEICAECAALIDDFIKRRWDRSMPRQVYRGTEIG